MYGHVSSLLKVLGISEIIDIIAILLGIILEL